MRELTVFLLDEPLSNLYAKLRAAAREELTQFHERVKTTTITIGVGVPIYLVRGDVYFWGSLMAACLIASLPIAVVYNVFLDRFIAGFAVGAVK